jgi:hypothetical protein
MLAERCQQIDHAGVPDPPEPRDNLGLGLGRHLGQQFGDDVARVRFLQQART